MSPSKPSHTSHEAKKMRLVIALFSAICLVAPSHADDNTGRKLRVVVFGGHPDDPESGAGGLIATLTRQGHEVICAYGTTFRDDRRFFGRPEGEVRQRGGNRRLQGPRCEAEVLPLCPRETGCRRGDLEGRIVLAR